MLKVSEAVDAKLRYLDELRYLPTKTTEEMTQQQKRINRVCDSIEMDLGMNKAETTET